MKLVEIFEKVPDFRTKCFVTHILSEILVISLCVVLSGAEDFEEIAEYAVQKEKFLKQFLRLSNGLPSHDTFNRVFRNLDTKSFEAVLRGWSKEILDELESYQINIEKCTRKYGYFKKNGTSNTITTQRQRFIEESS